MRIPIKMNTPAVNRLHLLARFMDELNQDLNRVEFLKGSIVDNRKFKECEDLTKKAHASVTKVRDAMASKGGSTVAKGYK